MSKPTFKMHTALRISNVTKQFLFISSKVVNQACNIWFKVIRSWIYYLLQGQNQIPWNKYEKGEILKVNSISASIDNILI